MLCIGMGTTGKMTDKFFIAPVVAPAPAKKEATCAGLFKSY